MIPSPPSPLLRGEHDLERTVPGRPDHARQPGERAPVVPRTRRLVSAWPVLVGLLFVAVALAVYVLSNPFRTNFYNHFVWQAAAWLDGRAAITWPVFAGPVVNWYFQDVYPLAGQPGLALIPFPPLPAVLLLPLVAVFGLQADAALLAAVLGAVNVGLAWRLASRVTSDARAAALATVFYGFGTVAWYAAMLGSTWFLAHVVASTYVFVAIALALDAERRESDRRVERGRWWIPRWRGLLAGFALGLAALARLTTIFGWVFFALVGPGRSIAQRALSAGLGAAIPLLALLAYNVAATGQPFNPAYEYLYQHEYTPRPELIHREWGIEDVRYIPQNLTIMLGWLPVVQPECLPAFFDPRCSAIRPDPLGMSLILTSPGYLLALPALAGGLRRRLVAGSLLAVLAIGLVNLAHFSQGWVQFGYRFSNDFAPFALVLVTLGIARLGVRPLTIALVALSVAINAWGVYWGVVLGW